MLFTSESVTEGHPDKICDAISDAVLDEIIAKELEIDGDASNSRCACEVVATTGTAFVAGEFRTRAYVDVERVVRDTVRRIGYDRAKYGFDADTCGVLVSMHEQSPDIAMGVDSAFDRRWRPRHHVRLRVRRDADAHAAAHMPCERDV